MPQWFDRAAAIFAAFFIIGLVAFLLIRNTPLDPQLFFALRVLLSLSAAILGATIPVFLKVEGWGGGLAGRGGGPLSLFLWTYVSPPTTATAPPRSRRAAITTDSTGGDHV